MNIYDNDNKVKKGFTLIELLVVMAIIGILAAASYAIINPAAQMGKARDSKRKADIAQIRAALELYRSDNGSYPSTDWVNSGDPSNPNWIPGLAPTYSKSIPKDPKNTGGYPFNGGYTYAYYSSVYCGLSPGTTYILVAHLENTSDPEYTTTIQYGSCSWGGSGSYTTTSP